MEENCPTCGCLYADDNDTEHECPPGFRETRPERLKRLVEEVVGWRIVVSDTDDSAIWERRA